MAGLEGFSALAVGGRFSSFLRGARYALLAKANCLNLVAFFSHNNVGFLRVIWGALRLVEAAYASPGQSWVFLVHLYLAVFLAILGGCFTNCLPAAVPLRLALVVAAYSAEVKDSLAFLGR